MKALQTFNVNFLLILLIPVMFLFSSCDKDTPDAPEQTANQYIYEVFKEWYLWNNEIPDIDPDGISTTQALIDSIINPLDRWSYSMQATKLYDLLQKGVYEGFGAGFIIDYDNFIKISYVFDDSPFAKAGVKRTWKVLSINGYTIDNLDSINSALSNESNCEFVFLDPENKTVLKTISKSSVKINSVMYSGVYTSGVYKVGYFVFDRFYETSTDELKAVVEKFKSEKITDLIIDLRYNGGGLNSVAYNLFSMLGGDAVITKTIATLINNEKHSDENNTIISSYGGPIINVPRLFFITTYNTASASEMVINCLKPYVDCTLIGNNTHGKPVGMYIFTNDKIDLSVLPISFKYVNSLGYGDYFNGLPADIYVSDDLNHEWGDPEENMLKAALSAVSGSPATISQLKGAPINLSRNIGYKGIYSIIQAY